MKIAFVTGASRGIGRALEDCLDQKGFQVVTFSRPAYDFSKLADIEKCATRILETPLLTDLEFACLINNAGTEQPMQLIDDLTTTPLADSVNVNLVAPTILCAAFLKLTKRNAAKKQILNVTSGLAVRSLTGSTAYCISKAGVEMLTRQITEEQKTARYPTVAVSLRPGVVDTAMQERLRDKSTNKMPSVEMFSQFKNEGQLVSPKAVAEATYRDIISGDITSGLVYRLDGGSYKVVV